jgi:hypothetical protein
VNISHDVHLLPLEDEYACLEKLFYLALFIIYTSSLPLPFCGLQRLGLARSLHRVSVPIEPAACARLATLSNLRLGRHATRSSYGISLPWVFQATTAVCLAASLCRMGVRSAKERVFRISPEAARGLMATLRQFFTLRGEAGEAAWFE